MPLYGIGQVIRWMYTTVAFPGAYIKHRPLTKNKKLPKEEKNKKRKKQSFSFSYDVIKINAAHIRAGFNFLQKSGVQSMRQIYLKIKIKQALKLPSRSPDVLLFLVPGTTHKKYLLSTPRHM